MVAGAASLRSLGLPRSASVEGWSRPIKLSALSLSGARGGGGSPLAISVGGSADGAVSVGGAADGAISAGDPVSVDGAAAGTGGLRGGFGGCGAVASASARGTLSGWGAAGAGER